MKTTHTRFKVVSVEEAKRILNREKLLAKRNKKPKVLIPVPERPARGQHASSTTPEVTT